MKPLLLAIGKTLFFLLVFLAGSLASPFHLRWAETHPTPTTTHFFVPDGLLLTIAAYLLLLVVELARKRLRTSGVWTTAAFVLALVLGFLAKFGSVTHDIY